MSEDSELYQYLRYLPQLRELNRRQGDAGYKMSILPNGKKQLEVKLGAKDSNLLWLVKSECVLQGQKRLVLRWQPRNATVGTADCLMVSMTYGCEYTEAEIIVEGRGSIGTWKVPENAIHILGVAPARLVWIDYFNGQCFNAEIGNSHSQVLWGAKLREMYATHITLRHGLFNYQEVAGERRNYFSRLWILQEHAGLDKCGAGGEARTIADIFDQALAGSSPSGFDSLPFLWIEACLLVQSIGVRDFESADGINNLIAGVGGIMSNLLVAQEVIQHLRSNQSAWRDKAASVDSRRSDYESGYSCKNVKAMVAIMCRAYARCTEQEW